jgi:tetratricopeptide (TPR) repeat protein
VFGALREWVERRRALKGARAVAGAGNQAFSNFFKEQIDVASDAFNRGAREQALAIWRSMHAQYPDLCLTSERAFNLLVDLGYHDEAEGLLREGRRRYPWHRAMFAAVSAHVAQSRGDLDGALQRCTILRRKFPRVAEGYTIAVVCLTGLGRHDEAEAMIERAARKFSQDFDIVVANARNAVRRGDWPNALHRWEAVKDRFDDFLGPVGMAQSLREMGRYAEAEELATMASERYPGSPWAFGELADIATARGDLEAASQRWEVARQRCPDFARAYTSGAEAERRLGQEAEADTILGLAVTRFRFDLGVHLEYARGAERRGDQAAAAERWALVRERFPQCQEAHREDGYGLVATEQKVGAIHAENDLPSAPQSSDS